MEYTAITEVRKTEKTWLYRSCDTCRKILDMNLSVNDRKKIITKGSRGKDYTITPYFVLCDYTYPDTDSEHFCRECMQAEIVKRLSSAANDFNCEIRSENGVIITGELSDMITDTDEEPAKSKTDDKVAHDKLMQSIADGTHPIITAEETMLKRLFNEGDAR